MKCNHCGSDNGSVKKCCHQCGNVLEGRTINNVTGKVGLRNFDGSFTPDFPDAQNEQLVNLKDYDLVSTNFNQSTGEIIWTLKKHNT